MIWKDLLDVGNFLVLLATGVVVFLYTKAAQKSNEIQERPILNLYLRQLNVVQANEGVLNLKNVGKGPAYNITFSEISAGDYKYFPYFNEPNLILESGGDKNVKFFVKTQIGGTEIFDGVNGFHRFLMRAICNTTREAYAEVAKTAIIFVISYEGVNGKKYHSVFRLYSKFMPILEEANVYDLVVEFIDNREGNPNGSEIKRKCIDKEIMKSF